LHISRGLIRPVLFLILFTAVSLTAARPEITMGGSLIGPRSQITRTEGLVWRGQLHIRHELCRRLSWNLVGDIAPTTLSRDGGLYIYRGQIKARLSETLNVAVGRDIFWSNLHTARYDGVTVSHAGAGTSKRTRITVYAGLTPDDDDVTATGYSQGKQLVAGGRLQMLSGSSRIGLQSWANYRLDELHYYLGATLRKRLGPVNQVVDAAYDISQSTLEKVRLRTGVKISNSASAFIQYRHAGHLTINPYPWVTEDTDFDPRHVVTVGGTYNINRRMTIMASLNQRLGSDETRYVSITGTFNGVSLLVRSDMQSIYEGQYVQLSGRRAYGKKMVLGGSLGFGSYTLFWRDYNYANIKTYIPGGDIPRKGTAQSAIAATFYVESTGPGHLHYRLYTQYTRNRFFKTDGRLGLQVTYAL
ncbi:MAG: hypothetical protein KAU50_03920, partial [Candidatus Marinimicrobia bacterium]|nr:hypothetical protein [Candidatus Neomarinimicrobiota bacterium]